MKALFVHNSVFQFAGDVVYSNNIPEQIWDRYLRHFDHLLVIGQGTDAHETGLNISGRSTARISFARFPDVTLFHELCRRRQLLALARQYVAAADAVIVRLPCVTGNIFLEAARQLNKPVAAEVVGSVWHEYWYRGGLWPKLLAPLRFRQTRRAVLQASHAIYVTAHFLQRLYPCNGVTANAANVDIRHINTTRRFSTGAPVNITVAATLDRYYKGYDVVLKALHMLYAKGWRNFVLHCAGDGDSSRITALAHKYGLQQQVRILGSLTRQRLMELLDNTDLYIQPSRTEGLPRALIEAMSRGCPCLASTAGGIPELLPPGYLHKPGDAARLAGHILRYADDTNEKARMSAHNCSKAAAYLPSVLEHNRYMFWKHFSASFQLTPPSALYS